MALKPYMGYSLDPSEGACLIFAHDVKEAKQLAWPIINDWFDNDYIALRVSLIRDEDHLFKEANQEKLKTDTAHVVEAPRGCDCCEKWGVGEVGDDGLCDSCRDDL